MCDVNMLGIESQRYLQSPMSVMASGLSVLLIGVNIYGIITNPEPYPLALVIVLLESFAVVGILLRRSRALVYVILAIALTIHLFTFTQIVANGTHDAGSTRDDAVEVTARALLRGENAWNVNPGVPATTGPTSILLALPFVLLFGQINWLSFGFWIVFFLVLLWCDIKSRNDTWGVFVLFTLLGLFGLEHTLYWSLEELYYPILFFALAYVLALQRQEWGIGALMAAAVLSRTNYAFLLIGFGLWYVSRYSLDARSIVRIGLSFFITSVVILAPFVLVGREDLVSNNPWKHALGFSMANWPDTNVAFRALNQMGTQLGADLLRWLKLGVTLLLIFAVAWRLNLAKLSHPFWHVAAAGFIAHTVFWLPAYPWSRDYSLIFVLPAMLGIALTRTRVKLTA
jgi:hypothetical protein